MVEFKTDAPLKILIEDVRHFSKFQDGWIYKTNKGDLSVNVNRIVIQGEIIKTAGFSNEILIIDDGTGKAKVTRGSQVPGDLSWINAGESLTQIKNQYEKSLLLNTAAYSTYFEYRLFRNFTEMLVSLGIHGNIHQYLIEANFLGLNCSVVGTLLENGKLPMIHADKIAKITNQVLVEMWPWEVRELRDVMANKCFPKLLDGDS